VKKGDTPVIAILCQDKTEKISGFREIQSQHSRQGSGREFFEAYGHGI
jgi:hypothetical protein